MELDNEKKDEFLAAVEPLVKFLNDNGHPHMTVLVTPTGAEIVEGVYSITLDKFVRD